MILFGVMLENRMNQAKKLYDSLNLAGSLTLAISIPWIIFRVFRAVCLQKNLNKLVGKVVVITGASSGLGEALAHEFYKHGCQVVLCARHIDILVNNGGISHRGSITSTNPDVDIKIMLVNYFGAAALTKAVLPDMIKRREGHIVFVSSVQGLFALPERSAYSASKHAMQAFADSLRAESSSYNISVTVVSPGYIKTNLSMNALTGSGTSHGQMDATTEQGYKPEYVAKKIVKAVVEKTNEIVVSTMTPKLALFLRKYLPSVYFSVMAHRAKKSLTLK
nr:unnamed protein product [Callosobruchus chinensis]